LFCKQNNHTRLSTVKVPKLKDLGIQNLEYKLGI
jgi:hypothetical protein